MAEALKERELRDRLRQPAENSKAVQETLQAKAVPQESVGEKATGVQDVHKARDVLEETEAERRANAELEDWSGWHLRTQCYEKTK